MKPRPPVMPSLKRPTIADREMRAGEARQRAGENGRAVADRKRLKADGAHGRLAAPVARSRNPQRVRAMVKATAGTSAQASQVNGS